ncbi:GAF domain-containing protein [Methanosphaerula palustris]|uniref:histidine kinase n=1 Tax=Methanosphaerula palustris (strain ATCC BAA-1556 / DSM 19958 / E1-9c) TaxID=521011 RepID=B8GGZ7_METPE|nr:GAF domain-containing sensor histidine kinase [Methanosphaerula palustris]ACL16402.1 multi-sensor signal transduction histidine kinase [Methanosphaerula palustris E1-9c]
MRCRDNYLQENVRVNGEVKGPVVNRTGWKAWFFRPVPHAALIAAASLLVLFPYWWLAIRWFANFNLTSESTYAFTSVTLMLVLITADSLFLFVYFHDAGKLAIEGRTRELIQQEALLRRELNLNRALADLAGALVTPGRIIEEVTMLVLSSAKELTGSPQGFVSVVDEKTGLMTSPTLNAMVAEGGSECSSSDQTTLFSRRPDGTYYGLIGHCLNTGKPIFTNAPDLHPSTPDLPEGHFPVTSFLAAPIVQVDATVVGQIALANAPDGYTDWELTAVSRLTELFSLAIQREQVNSSFRSRGKQLSLIIDGVPAQIGYVDADERYLYVNQAYADWYGFPRDSFVGRGIWEVLDEETYRSSSACFSRVLAGESVKMDYYTTGRDDYQHYLHVGFMPQRDEAGQVVAFFMLTQDITDQKRAEEGLRQANRKLNLLSGITRHDIQNQLTALLGYIDLSLEMTDDNNLQVIFRRENEQVAQIRSEITFTKGYEEVGVHSPEWQKVGMLIENAELMIPAGAVHLYSTLENLEIYADPLLMRVFYNLIENALRHGHSVTEIRFSMRPGDAGTLVLICEDDGDGVSEDTKERIFNKGVGSNTGLGLFLTREILAITGITITETGTPGRGARFEMVLPKGGYRNFVFS